MFHNSMRVILLTGLGFLGGCSYVDDYGTSVYKHKPIYCYQSLAGIECFKKPNHKDQRRLVNYYGPHPTSYDKPEPPDTPNLKAPKPINHWVKDPEPIPMVNSK